MDVKEASSMKEDSCPADDDDEDVFGWDVKKLHDS
jgi:hypothetical protein